MWDFLDVMDKNLLYRYAEALNGNIKFFRVIDYEIDRKEQAEQRKRTALYLIWFTYRYVLQCKTLEETIPYQDEKTLKRFRLFSMIKNSNIFICNFCNNEICFRKPEDISMILEILYNRYDLREQFDCFIRGTSGVRRKRCIEAKNEVCGRVYKASAEKGVWACKRL